ncbi:MAG: NAD(P)H-dependent oxidoreductase [Alphaproteobacteria bacterium]|nr:NAD(P)H-dependent oxidoreductase [Alphaproteobacteria bacterium]
MRVLVAFASQHGHTRAVAQRLAGVWRQGGHEVQLLDLTGQPDAPLADADLTVVASAVYSNQAHDDVIKWLRTHTEALAERRTALVSISLAAAIEGDEGEAMCLDYVAELSDVTGFEPGQVAMVAGALAESRYDPATRALLKVATWRRPLGLTGDVVLTDWDALEATAARWV